MIALLATLSISCAVTKIKKGEQYFGSSMDLLQDNQSIAATIIDDKLKVQIKAGTEKCVGEFEYTGSDKSYLGFTMASNNYVGKFKSANGVACKKAIGNNGDKTIEVQVARLGGILGSSFMSKLAIRICEDEKGICMAQNTFEVTKK